MQAPPPSNYPRQNLGTDRQNLRDIATSQRNIMYCVLGQFGIAFGNIIASNAHLPVLFYFDMVLAVGLLVFMIMSVIGLSKALGLSPVVYVILMFIPCVSLIMLISLSGKATTILKQAGIKVGFMGADPNSI